MTDKIYRLLVVGIGFLAAATACFHPDDGALNGAYLFALVPVVLMYDGKIGLLVAIPLSLVLGLAHQDIFAGIFSLAIGSIICAARELVKKQLWQNRDIAARMQAEARFQSFMQQFPGLAWIKDTDGKYVFVNQAATKVFGRDACGKTDDELFPSDVACQFRINDNQALENPSKIIETLVHDDGVEHRSIVTKFPIGDVSGKPIFVGGMAIDITDRLRVEAELERLNEELVEDAKLKDEFLATLAHELRNPLSCIANGLSLLKTGDQEPAVQNMMGRQVDVLIRLINDLLDISRINHGKLELIKEACDLKLIVQDAMDCVSHSEDHEIKFSLPSEPVHLVGDAARLSQIVSNLLNNSVKYTPSPGKIDLAVEVEEGTAIIKIKDNGIGIPPEKLSRIFGLFVQLDQSTSKIQSGLGIGLTLVKRLTELHGGTVEAHSNGPGKGSEFTVRIPLVRPQRPKEEPLLTVTNCKLRILLVDDNRDSALTLAMLLKVKGYFTQVAHDGPTALELVESYRPHVVVQDIGMPIMDGYQITQRLRERYSPEQLVIVAATGYGRQEDRDKTKAAGFNFHLVKPIVIHEFDSILNQCTQRVCHGFDATEFPADRDATLSGS